MDGYVFDLDQLLSCGCLVHVVKFLGDEYDLFVASACRALRVAGKIANLQVRTPVNVLTARKAGGDYELKELMGKNRGNERQSAVDEMFVYYAIRRDDVDLFNAARSEGPSNERFYRHLAMKEGSINILGSLTSDPTEAYATTAANIRSSQWIYEQETTRFAQPSISNAAGAQHRTPPPVGLRECYQRYLVGCCSHALNTQDLERYEWNLAKLQLHCPSHPKDRHPAILAAFACKYPPKFEEISRELPPGYWTDEARQTVMEAAGMSDHFRRVLVAMRMTARDAPDPHAILRTSARQGYIATLEVLRADWPEFDYRDVLDQALSTCQGYIGTPALVGDWVRSFRGDADVRTWALDYLRDALRPEKEVYAHTSSERWALLLQTEEDRRGLQDALFQCALARRAERGLWQLYEEVFGDLPAEKIRMMTVEMVIRTHSFTFEQILTKYPDEGMKGVEEWLRRPGALLDAPRRVEIVQNVWPMWTKIVENLTPETFRVAAAAIAAFVRAVPLPAKLAKDEEAFRDDLLKTIARRSAELRMAPDVVL